MKCLKNPDGKGSADSVRIQIQSGLHSDPVQVLWVDWIRRGPVSGPSALKPDQVPKGIESATRLPYFADLIHMLSA